MGCVHNFGGKTFGKLKLIRPRRRWYDNKDES
jgi:hypothetical protein